MADINEIQKRLIEAGFMPAPKPATVLSTPAEPAVPPSDSEKEYMKMAEQDAPHVERLRNRFARSSKRYGVPVEVLAGIASRESRGGKALNEFGYDDAKEAFGILQVDKRFHKLQGTQAPDSQEHIDQGASILKQYHEVIKKKHPKWSEEMQWRGAVAAYNMGPGNVKSVENLDIGTTGNDYSQDVMLRAKVYRDRWSKKK